MTCFIWVASAWTSIASGGQVENNFTGAFPNAKTEKGDYFAHQLANVAGREVHGHRPGKLEQLPDDFGGVQRALADHGAITREFFGRLAAHQLAQQQFRKANDGRELIVDFVGDAADERIEHRRFFLLDEAMFQDTLFGDVVEQGADLAGFPDPAGKKFETAGAAPGEVQKKFGAAGIGFLRIGFVLLEQAKKTVPFRRRDQRGKVEGVGHFMHPAAE